MSETDTTTINFRNTTFVGSFGRLDDVPTVDLPHVLIVGKSNVGKSSLLNALTGQKHARVSGTPGKTRLILIFDVDQHFRLVDLPGYGFAKAGKTTQQTFAKLTETFVLNHRIDLSLLLLDCRHEPTELDLHMLQFLRGLDAPWFPVLTKSDKCSQSELQRARRHLIESHGLTAATAPLAVSAERRRGIFELRERIAGTFGLRVKRTD